MTTPPRYLFRRFFALLVDYGLISILTTLMLLPLVRGNTDNFRLSGVFHSAQCQTVTSGPQSLHDLVAPAVISGAILCENKTNFVENGRVLKLVLDQKTSKNGNVSYSTQKTLELAISEQDDVIHPIAPQGLLDLVLLALISAFLLSRWQGKTPGKALLGLRVTGLGQGAALRREVARVLPLVFFQIFVFLPPSFLITLLNHFYVFTAGTVLLTIFLGWYYVWPLIRWQGQSRHDRFAGSQVERAN